MAKNYYVVLGINRGADLNKIKKAYRRIVKRHHPDVSASEKSSDRFREAREAYETLMDENKRRRYDAELKRFASPGMISRASDGINRQPHFFDEFDPFSSLADEFFEGFLPGFFGRERRDRRHKDIYLEVILSETEACNGGLFPIKVPVIKVCHRCSQSGYGQDFLCPVCGGRGRYRTEKEFSLSIPPRVPHGTQVRLSMEDIGLRGVSLYVLISIDPSMDRDTW